MSRTIAIITFKDMPDRKFKIKKSRNNSCGNKRHLCVFYTNTRCPHGSGFCSDHGGFYFKEIKK